MHLPIFVINAYLAVKSTLLRAALKDKVEKILEIMGNYREVSDERLDRDRQELLEGIKSRRLEAADVEVPLFALIAEYADRRLSMRPYPVQLLAALAMSRRKIIQMNTGEGKTLVAPFCAILDVVLGRKAIVLAPNEYLSYRDYKWMQPLYEAFGVSVAFVPSGVGAWQKSHLYSADVVYVYTSELVFDYLRQCHTLGSPWFFRLWERSVIIDEVDNVLLDQGVNALALTAPINFSSDFIQGLWHDSKDFLEEEDFNANRKLKTISFSEQGIAKVDRIARSWDLPFNETFFYINCALSARFTYRKDIDYLCEHGSIVHIDQVSGRPRRGVQQRYAVQQFIELKEGCTPTNPSTTINEISLFEFFSQFKKLCGMSGSVAHAAMEFKLLYRLEVIPIPPNRKLARIDEDDWVFISKAEQRRALLDEIEKVMDSGRPVLVGTTNVEDAEAIYYECLARGMSPHLLTAKNHYQEAEIIQAAGRSGSLTIAARMAGRGVDIKLDDFARAAGGLYVFGVSRSEARRLDEQLMGRGGRQGDPGSTRFIISLEDDLLTYFGVGKIKAILKSMGAQEGERIEHPLVSRSMSVTQHRLSATNYAVRRRHFIFSKFTRSIRQVVFERREMLLKMRNFDDYIKQLISDWVDSNARDKASTEEFLRTLAKSSNIILSPVLLLVNQQSGEFREQLKEYIKKEYESRKESVWPYSQGRETLILLRSVDYCWTLFLDESEIAFENLTMSFHGLSSIDLFGEISRVFLGGRAKLQKQIMEVSMRYLLKIQDDKELIGIKYWRGMGVTVGVEGEEGLNDGLEIPDAISRVYTSGIPTSAYDDLPAIGVSPAEAAGQPKLEEAMEKYLLNLREKVTDSDQIKRIDAVLKAFAGFVSRNEAPDKSMADLLQAYLESLRAQQIDSRRIGYIERDIKAFIKYYKKSDVTGMNNASETSSGPVAAILKNPLLLIRVFSLPLLFLAYRALSNIPLPFLPAGTSLVPDNNSTLSFLDQLLFAGSWTNAGAGIVGIMPLLILQILYGLFIKENRFFPLPLQILLALCICFGLQIWIGHSLGWQLSLLQTILFFLCLTSISILLLLLTHVVQFTEITSGEKLFVLGNGLIFLYDGLNPDYHRFLENWSDLLIIGAGILVIFTVYLWLSTHKIKIVRTAHFDPKLGKMKSVESNINFSLLPEGGHIIMALIVTLISINWIKALHEESNMLKFTLAPLGGFEWEILLFATVTPLFYYRSVLFRLSPMKILKFLEARKLFFAEAGKWGDGMRKLRNSFYGRILICGFLEFVLILMVAYLAGYIAPSTANRAASISPVYYATLLIMLMLFTVHGSRRILSSVSNAYESIVLFLPDTMMAEIPEIGHQEPIFIRAWKYLKGPLGFFVKVVLALEALKASIDLFIWVRGLFDF